MPLIDSVAASLLAAALVVGLGWLMGRRVYRRRVEAADGVGEQRIESAEAEGRARAAAHEEEAQVRIAVEREALEIELAARRAAMAREEGRFAERQRDQQEKAGTVTRKARHVEKRADELLEAERHLEERASRLEQSEREYCVRLEGLSGLSSADVASELRGIAAEAARVDSEEEARRIHGEALAAAERRGREILAYAIQRVAISQTPELTVEEVELPAEEMKGRIIGREGRNIRSFEREAGVDLVVDDTPKRVFVSCFDPERRAIACAAMERLVIDGRIHPARIENAVGRARDEFSGRVRLIGQQAAFDCRVFGASEDLIDAIGRMSFRSDRGQNLLQHCREVSWVAGFLAANVGADEALARRAGLLHGLGWTAGLQSPSEMLRASLEQLTVLGESVEVIEAVEGLRRGPTAPSLVGVLVDVGKTVSHNRPGARKDQLERYLRRMREIEKAARAIDGVREAHALQAGRELRVIVDHESVDDARAWQVSREVAQKLEGDVTYPGAIRVTVIRRTRVSVIAH